MEGRKNADVYARRIGTEMIPIFGRLCRGDWKYQQDSAPSHATGQALKCFAGNNVGVLPRRVNSPLVNIIENMEGCAQGVDGRQFETVEEI